MLDKTSLRIGALALCLSFGQLMTAATIRFDRNSTAGLPVGDWFSLEILGSDFADGSAGGGLDLSWNPDVLAVSTLDDVDLLFSGDKFVFDKGALSNAAGTLSKLSTVSFSGITDTAFKIARITFTAIAAGSSLIELDLGTFTAGGLNEWTRGDSTIIPDVAFEPASATVVSAIPVPAALYTAFYNYCITQYPNPVDQANQCPSPLADTLDTWRDYLRHVWWLKAAQGPDQLRQRMTFALSQILVVSDKSADLSDTVFGLASYYDVLSKQAFGNYRDVLEEVALHPVMGLYLSMLRHEKADPERNIRSAENFVRELLQLFSIGVHQLNPDGTLALGAFGEPIPTYDQTTIQEFARAFTGWNFANVSWDEWRGHANRTLKMVPVAQYHDTQPKLLLQNVLLPGGQTAQQDLDAALDNVFNHPNVGPFLASQLIKRFTTSNPSRAYVGRVAAVFNNNGSGVRGDLGAVLRAIVRDQEARQGTAVVPAFCKLRESVLRMTQVFRAFNARPIAGGDWDVPPTVSVFNTPSSRGIRGLDQDIGENVLGAPSVFNFFRPDYSPPGPVAAAGLTAPEFQLWTENTVMAATNLLNFHIQDAQSGGDWTSLNLAAEVALATQPASLLDRLDLLLTNGAMSPGLRQTLLTQLANSAYPNTPEGKLGKVRDAVSLIVNSPDYLIQKQEYGHHGWL